MSTQGRFHGGCVGCKQPLAVCHGCQYRKGNWTLPSLHNTTGLIKASKLDPNKAFKERKKKPYTPHHLRIKQQAYPTVIKFTGGSHLITFTCPRCNYTYDVVFHKGMALHTENLGCTNCNLADMDYHID